MTKKQHYMTWDERQKLEVYYNVCRYSVSKIAELMGFNRQTIYNELALGAYMHTCDFYDRKQYSAQKAQDLHDWKQTAKGRPENIGNNHKLADYLEDRILHFKDSPAVAFVNAAKAGFELNFSLATFYNYIHKGLFRRLKDTDLWECSSRKHYGSAKSRKKIAHPDLPSISDRSDDINNRIEYGHWEMDLIVGKKGSSSVLLTLTERQSRYEIIIKLPNRKAKTIRKAFDRLERKYGKTRFRTIFKTITTDNGSEFLQHADLCKSVYGGIRFVVYYCHSFAAWEKGTNENHNRMIRRWFPKGTDFDKVTAKEITRVEEWMNNYPRKILGWLTPKEAAAEAQPA